MSALSKSSKKLEEVSKYVTKYFQTLAHAPRFNSPMPASSEIPRRKQSEAEDEWRSARAQRSTPCDLRHMTAVSRL